MKASEIREMSLDEMNQKIFDLKEEYFNLRFQHETGQLENTCTISKIRKNIARVMTISNEKKSN